MGKALGRVFFFIALAGFLGALGWGGYLYYETWKVRDTAYQAELQTIIDAVTPALEDGGWQNETLPEILSRSLTNLRHYRFLALSTPEGKIARLVARPGIRIPADLASRAFPGFTAIPYYHHTPRIVVQAGGTSFQVAGWRDPEWTLADLNRWLYPGIVLAGTFVLGLIFVIILAALRPRSRLLPEDDLPLPSETDSVPEHLPPLQTQQAPPASAPQTTKSSAGSSRLFDSDGFVWEDVFDTRLATELDRSAADNQDLALVLCSMEDVAGWPQAAQAGLSMLTSYRDLVFKWKDGFSVILPKTSLDRAFEETQDFLRQLRLQLPGSKPRAGISARSGRLLSAPTLVKEATEALAKTGAGQDNVVGFRADPQLYREYLSGQNEEGGMTPSQDV